MKETDTEKELITQSELSNELDEELLAAEMANPPAQSMGDILSNILQQALEAHQCNGNPVAEWRDGQIVLLPPKEEND